MSGGSVYIYKDNRYRRRTKFLNKISETLNVLTLEKKASN